MSTLGAGGVKEKLVASADALCAAKALDKCLQYAERAAALDPGEKAVSKRVANIRLAIAAARATPPGAWDPTALPPALRGYERISETEDPTRSSPAWTSISSLHPGNARLPYCRPLEAR